MILINLFDKCPCSRGNDLTTFTHNKNCYGVEGKQSLNVEITTQFSENAAFNLYTGDGLTNHFENFKKHSLPNILWLQEPRILGSWHTIYDSLIADWDRYMNSPHGFKYIFTHDHQLIANAKEPGRIKFLLGNGYWITEAKLYPKNKNISMICSNKRLTHIQKRRAQFANQMSASGLGVSLFGKDRPNKGINYELPKKEHGLCDYRFSIAMENGLDDAWITEKVLDCFATGTIPIYYGTRKLADYFNPDGIIFLTDYVPDLMSDDYSPTKAIEKWNSIHEQFNEELYKSKQVAIEDNLERVKQIELPIDYIAKEVIQNLT